MPLNNLQVEIANNNIPLVVAATSTEARTVEFSSPPNPPVSSCSAGNHPPAVKTNKRKRRAKKTPRAKSSITYSLPGEANCHAPIFDTHCHLDRLFRKGHHCGILEDYLIGRGRGVSPSFRSCNAVFCDPPQLLTTNNVEHFLVEEGVYGVVGCHPKMAQRFDGTVKACIIDLLQHPKVMALGEVGLDFSGNISKREQGV